MQFDKMRENVLELKKQNRSVVAGGGRKEEGREEKLKRMERCREAKRAGCL